MSQSWPQNQTREPNNDDNVEEEEENDVAANLSRKEGPNDAYKRVVWALGMFFLISIILLAYHVVAPAAISSPNRSLSTT